MSATPSPHPDSRLVRITTDPPGCQIAVVPLDSVTYDPISSRIVRAPEESPVELNLLPGDYLVVAVKDSHTFHEVFRHVPSQSEVVPHLYSHQAWQIHDHAVEFPLITLRPPTSKVELIPVPDCPGILVTSGKAPADFAQRISVPGFLAAKSSIDRATILESATVDHASTQKLKTPSNYHTAVAMAEQAGLRLPSAAELAAMAVDRVQLGIPRNFRHW